MATTNKTFPEDQHGPDKHGSGTMNGWIQREYDARSMGVNYGDRVSWWAVFYKSVPDAIGIGGMKYAFNPAEMKWRRFFWLLLILAAFGVLSYHVINRAQHLSTYPTSVDVYTNYTDYLTFPTVAVCNYNAFRYSVVAGTELEAFLTQYALENSYTVHVNTSSPYAPFLDNVTMTYLFTHYGHRLEDSVVVAYWKSGTILDHTNFTVKITDWGLCFIFNGADNGNPPLTVNRPGKAHGLDITLNVEQYEDFLDPTGRFSTGFQVLLYDYGTEPLVTDQGFGIAPGTHTHVAVEVTESSSLEPPYGLCQDKPLKYFDNYGYPECYIECRTDFFYEACGCRFYATAMNSDDEECTAWEYFLCGSQYYDEFINNHTCDCPVPCHIRSYKPTISTTAYPSAYFDSTLSSAFSLPEGFAEENFCHISIYFKEISIQQINQKVDYNFFGFLCDMGGSLGLWLGGSILTFFELLDLIGNSVYVYSKRLPNVKK